MKCEVCGATSSRRCRLHMRFISQCTCIRCTVTCQTRHRKRGQHSCFARVGFATNTASSVSIRARDSYCTAALLLRFLYVTRRDLEKCLRFFFLFFFFSSKKLIYSESSKAEESPLHSQRDESPLLVSFAPQLSIHDAAGQPNLGGAAMSFDLS